VLAAGNGDRFVNGTKDSKLLHPILGQPLLLRTLTSAHEAGIDSAIVVLGYQAERVRALVERGAPRDLAISFSHNPEWRLENGVSVLAARPLANDRRFALLMGDHIFEPPVLRKLLAVRAADDESVLAVDSRPASPDIAAEATKVRRSGSRIVAIGKDLMHYDALDTGLFVCSPTLFAALDTARDAGDTTLSAGIRELARRGLMRAHEIGDTTWCDIDTVSDLEAAESALTLTHEPA
jgi:choline kinase